MLTFDSLVSFFDRFHKHEQPTPKPPAIEKRENTDSTTSGNVDEKRRKAFAKKCIDSAVDRILTAPKGERNKVLNSQTYQIFQLVAGKVISHSEAYDAIFDAAVRIGLPGDEISKTMSSAITKGSKEPRGIPDTNPNYTQGSSSSPPSNPTSGTTSTSQRPNRPRIRVNDPAISREDVVSQVLHLLDRSNRVFLRDGNLVTVCQTEDQSGESYLSLDQVTFHTLPILAEKEADFLRIPSNGGNPKLLEVPPDWLMRAIVGWHFKQESLRSINSITSFPVLLPNGKILDEPGYNSEFGIWYQPKKINPPLPRPEPTRANAIAAKDQLFDLLVDFPFEFEASKSTWLAMMLTIQLRPMIFGPTPLFGVDASISGSGKGKLCQAAQIIATGQTWPPCVLPAEEEEQKKTILAYLLEGRPIIYFDNVRSMIKGSTIEAALTGDHFNGRLLGTNKSATARIKTTWMATGNSLTYSEDVRRRVIPIRLSPDVEDPSRRSSFKYEDFLGHIRENQYELQECGMTILRSWVAAGCPLRTDKLMGSYESWHSILGGICEFLKISDPLEMKENQIFSGDDSYSVWLELIPLLDRLFEGRKLSSREIITEIKELPNQLGGDDRQEEIIALITTLSPKEKDFKRINSKLLGWILSKGRGRVSKGIRLKSVLDRTSTLKWYCERIDDSAKDAEIEDRESEPSNV